MKKYKRLDLKQIVRWLRTHDISIEFNTMKDIFDSEDAMRKLIPISTKRTMIDILIHDKFELTEEGLQILFSKLIFFNDNPDKSPKGDRELYKLAHSVLYN